MYFPNFYFSNTFFKIGDGIFDKLTNIECTNKIWSVINNSNLTNINK